jgi:hypothetical protein
MQTMTSGLLECEYFVGPQRKSISIKLGLPRPSKYGDWECEFQFVGLRNNRVHRIYGVDGLQAITLAASTIRAELDSLKDVTSDTEPYECVFPEYVPTSYGLKFNRYLCDILRKEIEKKNKQLSRRRLARKRSR